jgi:hypothetical protein
MLNQLKVFSSVQVELLIQLQNANQEQQWEEIEEISKEIKICSLKQSRMRVSALINLAHEKNLDQSRQFQIAMELLTAGYSPVSHNSEEIIASCIMACISSPEHNEVLSFFVPFITYGCDAKKIFSEIVDAVIRIGDDNERSRCASAALTILSQLPPYSISAKRQNELTQALLEIGNVVALHAIKPEVDEDSERGQTPKIWV